MIIHIGHLYTVQYNGQLIVQYTYKHMYNMFIHIRQNLL